MKEEIFQTVEQNLRVRMRPLQPAPEFVDHLRNKLANRQVMEVERLPDQKKTWLKIVIGLVITTALILVYHKSQEK